MELFQENIESDWILPLTAFTIRISIYEIRKKFIKRRSQLAPLLQGTHQK